MAKIVTLKLFFLLKQRKLKFSYIKFDKTRGIARGGERRKRDS